MSVDDKRVKNIYHYTRKTFKNSKNSQESEPDDVSNVDNIVEVPTEENEIDIGENCHCMGKEVEIRRILHKKCPVIDLAQQQLQRLMNETDTLLQNSTQDYRSIYKMISLCKEIVCNNKYECAFALTLVLIAFLNGVIVGAATCGNEKGRFNSPILACIDERFTSNSYTDMDRSIT